MNEQLKIKKALFALNDLTLEQIDKVVKEIKTLKTFFIKDNSISNRRTTIDYKPIESFELEEDEIQQMNIYKNKDLEDLLEVRKKLVKAKEMYAEVKSYEDKLGTAHYRNTTIRILDDLEPLTIYIIEHSGLDPKH